MGMFGTTERKWKINQHRWRARTLIAQAVDETAQSSASGTTGNEIRKLQITSAQRSRSTSGSTQYK